MTSYLLFLRTNFRPVGFGLSLTFFSSFGQTFLISLYVPHIMRDLGITGGMFGALYAAATILSAILLVRFGNRIDKKPLRPYTRRTVILLSLSCAALGISVHPFLLAPALLGLRFSGQGLMSHISQTVMARHFDSSRGKALSVSALGYSLGEMILPVMITAIIPIFGWRLSLGLSGLVIVVLLLLYISTLPLEEYNSRTEDEVCAVSSPGMIGRVFRSPLFWILAPTFFIISFTTTGIFFYQLLLVEERGWSPEWYAAAFGGYALTRFLVSMGGGSLVDRLTAQRMYPLHILPMLAGLVILGISRNAHAARAFLILTGITMGMSGVIKSALLAEVFGKDNIGTVRSVFTAVAVLGTAVGPLVFGIMLDSGFSFSTILPAASVLAAVGAANSFRLWKLEKT